MSNFEDDEIHLLNDPSRESYYTKIESATTYTILRTLKETSHDEENGTFPIFLLAGPKISLFRFVRLISFLLIVFLFRIYTQNSHILLRRVVHHVFPCYFNSDQPFNTLFLLPLILSGFPLMLSLLFGFLSDYIQYQRVYLFTFSLLSSTLSALFLMLYSFSPVSPGSTCAQVGKTAEALVVLSVVFYIIGFAIFLPISLPYGLDLLGDTSWNVKYLYFPMYYVAINITQISTFIEYFHILDSNEQNVYIIIFSFMLFTLFLYFFFRAVQIFPTFDKKSTGFKVISFRKGVEIFWNALKVRCSGQKSPRGHWFIQLSSDAHYGKYPRKQVQMVASLFEIHFLFLFLLFIFAISHTISTLFPKQASLLYPPVSKITDICTDHESPTLRNLKFIKSLTFVLCTPFIEYYFNKVIFYFDSPENLNNNKKSLWKKVMNCLRCFDRYWLVYDPILKRIFWGSIFGLISVLFAFSVEIYRIHTPSYNLTCNSNHSHNSSHNYTISHLSIFLQIPQYIASGILEIMSYIGCLQFVYFQSTNAYKDNLLGHFFGLFYFYNGLATLISSFGYYIISLSCNYQNCESCPVYVETCSAYFYPLGWVQFVVLGLVCLLVIILFAWFSHYRHYQLSKIKEDFFFDEEG